MSGKTYVTKGYSTYTDIPAGRGGYDHEPKNPVNQYAVESKTIEKIRGPAAGFTNFAGSPSKIELLNEYVYSPGMSSSPNAGYDKNYEKSSPTKFHNEGSWTTKTSHFTSPNKYHPSSTVHGYHSEETHMVQSRPGFTGAGQVGTGNISGPNRSWQSAGPPTTHHHLTTSTNNMNEPLGFLESVTHPPRPDSRQRGVLDELSTRPQPQEPQKRYARPSFFGKPNGVFKKRY